MTPPGSSKRSASDEEDDPVGGSKEPSDPNAENGTEAGNDTDPNFISRQTTEAKRFYLDLDPPPDRDLSVVCGGVERISPDYVVQRSDFPYYGVELVTEGQGSLTYDTETLSLTRGNVFAYGPGIPHRIENTPPGAMRKYYLDFVGTSAEQLLTEAGLLDRKPVLVGGVVELTDLWDSMGREAREDSSLANRICQSLVRILLLKVQQRRIAHGNHVPTAYRTYESVRKYMEDNYLHLSTVEQVATACDISPVYVSRLFNRYCTMGAYQFLLRLRMNHAAELLMDNGLLVREVASQLGFADAFQFSRAFKRVYGVAPSHLHQTRSRKD